MATRSRMQKVRGTVRSHPLAVGAGLAAAAATAYYLFGSRRATDHRRKVKSWMGRMKTDVMREVSMLKDVNKNAYDRVVSGISDKYKQLKEADPEEVAALATRMKDHWNEIRKDIERTAGTARRTRRSTMRSSGRSRRSRS